MIRVACCALALGLGASVAKAQRAVPVELELVLAVDASSSVDMEEFNLQMHGLAEAFQHPAVLRAIQFAMQQFEQNRFEGARLVIDISGEGRANVGDHPAALRDRAVAQGITVDGLVILNEDPAVDSYYLANVVGGTSAFLTTVDSHSDFAAAVLKKLVREIRGAPIASNSPPERSILAMAN